MKRILFAVMVALVVSCGIEEIGRRPGSTVEDVWLGPGMNVGAGSTDKAVTYITALDYPDGYNWRVDREKGTVRCSLVVYADGVPMMKIPVGDRYEVSSDPDMHRMVKGHLYTDFSTDSMTVIKRDGKEIFRYSGREMICALEELDGDVYTLGHSRDGDGFSYRKNGNILLERSLGRTFGRLSCQGDTLSFAFCEPIKSDDAEYERYYFVMNGKVSQAAVREDVKKVWDMVLYKGNVCFLASVVGISAPVLFCSDDDLRALYMPNGARMLTCCIIHEDGALCVEGVYELPMKPLTSGLWRENGDTCFFADGMTVSSICMNGDGAYCVLNDYSSSSSGSIYRFGELFPMEAGYGSISDSAAKVIDGILYVGLSSFSCAEPLLWKDGETTPLRINGFISTVSAHRN